MRARTDDRTYFQQRAAQCRTQAEQARDPAVRQIHLLFAAAYQERAQAEEPEPAMAA
ncbi:hypothetical protein [uncultured Sphingomonas sp.]|uniref:hypothetical protein n=1 Tax=uncultured Sphingomonas sp. TaxID=158754 RepID=UPI0025D746C1|nr:hypothetical protein [uncultured Sphingomonas sp.]